LSAHSGNPALPTRGAPGGPGPAPGGAADWRAGTYSSVQRVAEYLEKEKDTNPAHPFE